VRVRPLNRAYKRRILLAIIPVPNCSLGLQESIRESPHSAVRNPLDWHAVRHPQVVDYPPFERQARQSIEVNMRSSATGLVAALPPRWLNQELQAANDLVRRKLAS
jgi:hypothetical protein